MNERLGHGRFGDWLQAEFEMDVRQAQRFVSVAEWFGKNAIIAHLPPTMIYALAEPTPQEVVAKARVAKMLGRRPTGWSLA